MINTPETPYLTELQPIEIFRTDVRNRLQAQALITELLCRFPWLRINFDLEDRERILRVEGENIFPEQIITIVKSFNFDCEIIH
ncbi:MAG: hypothetical protein V4635_13235 [Bacteroidota bacterium]